MTFSQRDINFIKCGICCGLEIIVAVDDSHGINIFYIDHVRAVLHNQKLKEQAKNSNAELIKEDKWKRIFFLCVEHDIIFKNTQKMSKNHQFCIPTLAVNCVFSTMI